MTVIVRSDTTDPD